MIYFITNQKKQKHSNIKFIRSLRPLLDFLNNLENKIFTLDTETTGLDAYTNNLLLIQFGNDIDQYVVDCRIQNIHLLAPYIESKDYIKILANAKFDYKQLWHHLGIHLDNVYDVLLVDRLIHNGHLTNIEEIIFKNENNYSRFSLKGLAIKYLNKTMQKETRNSFINHSGDFTISQIEYAASDIDIPYLLKPILDKKVEQLKLEEVVTVENNVTVAFADMEYNGVTLDVNEWNGVFKENVQELNKIEIELDKQVKEENLLSNYVIGKQLGLFAGTDKRDVNVKWTSPKQKIEILNKLGFEIDITIKDKITKEYRQSVDINVLAAIKNKHPLIPILIKYGELSKSISSYGDKFLRFIHEKTGRIHSEIFQIKETGRTGSGQPNIQNIPAKSKYRSCFIAPEGKDLIVTDYSNMELRIIADKSKEDVLIKAFKNGEDVHSQMAMMIQKVVFQKDITISKNENSELRTESKTITFLTIFGGSAYRLKDEFNIEFEVAENLLESYFKAFPKLKTFVKSLQNFGITKGYIRTFKPYNRIRWFPQFKEYKALKDIYSKSKLQFKRMMMIKGEIERASSNTPIQGSAADIMKIAVYNLHKYIIDFNRKKGMDSPKNKNRVMSLFQVHDEIVIECLSKYSKEIAQVKKTIMEEASKKIMQLVDMIAEPNITKKWQK